MLGNRVYFGYGTLLGGVIQIVDREKLLKGNPASSDPFAPTPENLLYPQVSRLVDTARRLEGVARHASTHAAGVVI